MKINEMVSVKNIPRTDHRLKYNEIYFQLEEIQEGMALPITFEEEIQARRAYAALRNRFHIQGLKYKVRVVGNCLYISKERNGREVA